MNIPEAMRKPLAVMFLIFMSMLFIFAWGITNNANKLKDSVYESCMARSAIESNTNRILDQLIENAMVSTVFPPAEQAERIAGWRAVRQPVQECVRL